MATAGWAGLWNHVYGEQHALIDSEHMRRQLSIAMRNYRVPYNRIISAKVQGVGNIFGDYERVKAQDPKDATTLGGKRPIETKIVINRAPTTQDTDNIREDLYNFKRFNPWPADKSGNGMKEVWFRTP